MWASIAAVAMVIAFCWGCGGPTRGHSWPAYSLAGRYAHAKARTCQSASYTLYQPQSSIVQQVRLDGQHFESFVLEACDQREDLVFECFYENYRRTACQRIGLPPADLARPSLDASVLDAVASGMAEVFPYPCSIEGPFEIAVELQTLAAQVRVLGCEREVTFDVICSTDFECEARRRDPGIDVDDPDAWPTP